MMLGLMMFSGTSLAATWEYAFLTTDQGTMTWQVPNAKWIYTNTDDYVDLLGSLKCKITPNGSGRFNFLNCVGALGWEYVGTEISRSGTAIQLFRKQKP